MSATTPPDDNSDILTPVEKRQAMLDSFYDDQSHKDAEIAAKRHKRRKKEAR